MDSRKSKAYARIETQLVRIMDGTYDDDEALKLEIFRAISE